MYSTGTFLTVVFTCLEDRGCGSSPNLQSGRFSRTIGDGAKRLLQSRVETRFRLREQNDQRAVCGPDDGGLDRGPNRCRGYPRLIGLIAKRNTIYGIVNCHVQHREDATLGERVRIGHGGGVGRNLIPPRDFVTRSRAGDGDGQQHCGYRCDS